MNKFNKIAIVTVTKEGKAIAKRLQRGFSKSKVCCFDGSKGKVKEITKEIFDREKCEGIIYVMALGIVARLIAPYLRSKHDDPAVVVVDDFARYCISALSGHEGGANGLALQAGNILDAEPVITTATEALKDTIIGIGCRKGIKKEEVVSGIKMALKKAKSSLKRARYLATIDLKAKEKGLCEASQVLRIPLRIISRMRIKHYQGAYMRSAFVLKKIGIEGVSEPCALLAGKRAKLVVPKMKLNGLTVAIAKEN